MSHAYFQGIISTEQLIHELKEALHITSQKVDVPKDERIMLIANHPRADSTLTLPATHISDLKGGNTQNFPSFWFPIIRQILLRDSLQRRFVTIAHDIGWNVAMHELWHFPITAKPGGRCKKIINSLSKDNDCSIVIFPEGRATDLADFHSGFFHIAKALNIKTLVTAFITPMLSLYSSNELKILTIEDINLNEKSIDEFVNKKREMLMKRQ